MTPLAAMAKARWEAQAKRIFYTDVAGTNGSWEALGHGTQMACMEDIRAALLVLAECEWPKEVRQAAAADVTDDPMLSDMAGRMAEKSARALLNALARPPSDVQTEGIATNSYTQQQV